MTVPTFKYCCFLFDNGHYIRVRVTPSLNLEWHLYINDIEVGRHLDETTNILLHKELTGALDYIAVLTVYNDLLPKAQPNG
jgi:hypothetical protein